MTIRYELERKDTGQNSDTEKEDKHTNGFTVHTKLGVSAGIDEAFDMRLSLSVGVVGVPSLSDNVGGCGLLVGVFPLCVAVPKSYDNIISRDVRTNSH